MLADSLADPRPALIVTQRRFAVAETALQPLYFHVE
jgi:hypothetical protein